MKKQTILLSALALTMLASCEKEVVNTPTETKGAQITMQLGQYGESKGIGTPTTVTSAAVGTGFIVQGFNGTAALGSSKVNFTKTVNTYTATAPVDVNATTVKLTGNYDGTIVNTVTLTPNVNTRQGDMSNAVVQVSGEGVINNHGTPAAAANVSVSPEMARIEILGNNVGSPAATSNFTDVRIQTIYLNNVKLNRDDAGLSLSTGVTDFANHYTTPGATIKPNLFDKPTTASAWELISSTGDRTNDVFGGGNAVGYNIFPQEESSTTATSPHIILYISYKEKSNPTVENFGYLNIKAFTDGSGSGSASISSFKAGKVYSFTAGAISDILDKEDVPITPTPDPEEGSVAIICTVATWDLVTVTPEV